MAPAELEPGDVFAGHRIESIAGRGGMGIVYRARQLDLDRAVALKLIASTLAEDAGFRDRFIRESRLAASIDHPNVIPVFYAGSEDDRLYIAMRYVAGDDLRTLVRREGRLAPGRAAHIVAQVGAALDAAHATGIVHRDVKPANVLLGDGDHAYLTDFGLTKRVASAGGGGTEATRAGGWVGTLGYVSPEQIRGEAVDARADVYALGCVLYQALTGSTPYQRDTDEAMLWAHLNQPPPTLAETAPEVPAAFDEVIARAVAKDPAERYPSAGDLGRAALAAAGRGGSPGPERVVARGDAALLDGEETVVSPSRAATVPADTVAVGESGGKRHRPATPLLILIGSTVLLVGGIVALLLAAGGGNTVDEPAATTATRTATAAAEGPEVKPFGAGFRPNTVVATNDFTYVGSPSSSRLTVLAADTGARAGRAPAVGAGVASVAAGFGSLWVAKGRTQTLLRYSLETGRRQGAPVPLPPGQAVIVATDKSGVWVGSRAGANRPVPSTITRVPENGGTPRVIDFPRGVQNLAVGGGYVWILDRSRRRLTRLRISDATQKTTNAGPDAYAVAYASGRVWVSNEGNGTVSEYSAARLVKLRDIQTNGQSPKGIDVGGGSVWVANNLSDTATRIDAATGKAFKEPVAVGTNPLAVSVRGDTAWITLQGDGEVARVAFDPSAKP